MTGTVYLDNAATTPVDPRVVAAMLECLGPDRDFANPSSVAHEYGRRARDRVEEARAHVAALAGVAPEQVIWTSGATEADNLAILGAARFYRGRGRHLVTSRTEHAAVLDPCRQLEREGFEVTFLRPHKDGIVEPAQLEEALRPDTILVSLMHVNNETGVVQDIEHFAQVCRARNVLLHVDAAQGFGKLPLSANRWGVDLLSLTAHKLYGPKGVGALCVRQEPRVGLVPLMFGGGQERGLRSGTLPTHQVVGMGEASRIAAAEVAAESARVAALRDRLWQGLSKFPGVYLNGHPERRVSGILNVAFEGVEGESLMLALSDLAVSSGSACASGSGEPSYVLRSLGRSDSLAQSSLRFSVGRFSTTGEVDYAVRRVGEELVRLRSVAPRHPGGA